MLCLLCFALLVPMSYALAPLCPFGIVQPNEVRMFNRFVDALPLLSAGGEAFLKHALTAEATTLRRIIGAGVYAAVLLVASATFVVFVVRLVRSGDRVQESVVSKIYSSAVMFGVISVFAFPMFTQDIWCSIAWGRMIADGVNPYYHKFTPNSLAGLPMNFFPEFMTYGPLWALTAAALSWLAAGRVLVEFLLFKTLLLGCWIFCLGLVRQIMRSASARDRALALCVFGWTPMSAHLTVGEGHNDVVMLAGLLLWLFLIKQRKHLLSPIALTASILFKYATAPLMALELWQGWRVMRGRRRRYLAVLAVGVGLTVLVFSPFFRDMHFFDGTREMRRWTLLTPQKAIVDVGQALGLAVPLSVVSAIVGLVCVVGVGYYLRGYLRRRSFDSLAALVLVIFMTILLTATGHIWPWYLLWVLAIAAVVPTDRLVRLVVPVALVAPFVHLYWLLAPGWGYAKYVTVCFVVLSILMAWASWRMGKSVVATTAEDS